jgi:hypothetical protein
MTKEEYDKKLESIAKRYNTEINQLKKEYALTNNTVKLGDVITDHMGSIKVDNISITMTFSNKYPICLYSGIEILKSGKPSKRGSIRNVYQSNLRDKQNG